MKQKRAAQAIETGPPIEERIEWLLKFLQRDVGALRVGELLDVGIDAIVHLLDPRAVIAEGEDDADAVILFREIHEFRKHDKRPSFIPPGGAGTDQITENDVMKLDRALLRQLQDAVKDGVAKLEASQEWLPFANAAGPPQVVLQRREDGTLARSYYAGPVLPVLLASVTDLLVEAWPEIRRCAYAPCGLLFRQTHGRQQFHDPKCSKLARFYRLPKRKRDYKQELANAHRRESLMKKTANKRKGR